MLPVMTEANITDIRQNLAAYLKVVAQGETVTLLHHGKPVAKIVPVDTQRADAVQRIEALRASAEINDVVSPIDVPWDALQHID